MGLKTSQKPANSNGGTPVVTTAPTPLSNNNRPTFQRSTVSNTPTTLPPAYRPPTTDDLRKAITNLNSSSTTK